MKKEDKGQIIAQLAETIQAYPHFYLVDVTALDAAATSDLRRKCFKQEIKMVVVKNTLLQKALESLEGDFSPLYGTLKGTTALFFCQTANVPARLLKEYADKKGIVYKDMSELLKNNEIMELFREHIDTLQQQFAHYEQIKKFTLLPEPFSMAKGELTNTLKIKRSVLNKNYAAEIEKMYEE